MRALWVWPTWRRPNRTFLEVSALKVGHAAAARSQPVPDHCRLCPHESPVLFAACSSTANKQGVIYLNTGLTSTKNYGKTILTKVGVRL